MDVVDFYGKAKENNGLIGEMNETGEFLNCISIIQNTPMT